MIMDSDLSTRRKGKTKQKDAADKKFRKVRRPAIGSETDPSLTKRSPHRIKQDEIKPTSWATKEGLIILSFILICLFSLMELNFDRIWESYSIAFQVLSGVLFFIFLIIAIFGFIYIIIERKHLWTMEREGITLIISGSLLTILLPLYGALSNTPPQDFFNENYLSLGVGTILIIIGALTMARFGGYFTAWFVGLVYYLVISFHEAFLVIFYTHHYGPYDTYYGTLGLVLIIISIILFIYHELKFLYLGKLLKRASDHRLEGQYNKALILIRKALNVHPRYVTAWNNKGNVLCNLGRNTEAIKCYDKALSIAPGFSPAKKNKYQTLLRINS